MKSVKQEDGRYTWAARKRHWELARSRYELGAASIVALSQTELSKTQAQIENANAKFEYEISRAALDFQTRAFRYIEGRSVLKDARDHK